MPPRQRVPRQPATRRRTVPPQPVQRPSELELLGLAVEDLAVEDHEARDARLHDALEWRAG